MELKAQHLTRQLDLIPEEALWNKINLIGAGAVGGWTAFTLAKMGFEDIVVWDFDEVEIENMSSQIFGFDDIGKNKAEALRDIIERFTGTKVTAIPDRFEQSFFSDIVITAVDSMEARRSIWESAKGSAQCSRFIDPRMGAEAALMYVVDPHNRKEAENYEKSLYSDDDAVQERCTAKATVYTANILSGFVVKAVKDVTTKAPYTKLIQSDIGANDYVMHMNEKGGSP